MFLESLSVPGGERVGKSGGERPRREWAWHGDDSTQSAIRNTGELSSALAGAIQLHRNMQLVSWCLHLEMRADAHSRYWWLGRVTGHRDMRFQSQTRAPCSPCTRSASEM